MGFRVFGKQIVSERSLSAVQELVAILKRNVRRLIIPRADGYEGRVRQITNELERGGPGIRSLLEQGWLSEGAAALEFFLVKLRKPLIPTQIQALALDENPGVAPEVVAQDMLGLLQQDISGRHAALIKTILDFLYSILKHSPTDELSGCNVPVSMFMIFFNLQTEHLLNWTRVFMIFVEMIRLAPTYFDIPIEQATQARVMDDLEMLVKVL